MLIAYLVASGLAAGSLYALVALGMVLVYRATGHINFAHGEQYMLGGFVAYTVLVVFSLPFALALACAALAGFAVGALSDRLIYRPLMDAPALSLILATIGLSFVLKGAARWMWGGLGEQVPFPALVAPSPIQILGVPVFPQQLVVVAAASVIFMLFTLFFRYTLSGRMMEATAENRRASYLVGIRVERVYLITWGMGGLVAALAAVFMAPLVPLNPDVGFGLLVKAFAAVVLGGLGSIRGAVVGGLAIGLAETLAGGLIHSSLQSVSAFVIIFVVLAVRPSGLFGTSDARVV